ncbi:DUF3558 domain-containing protein [Nocardia flavorosea]|uniref:DUF3558 domain-containing protein n=1 Tax=Nocardia flavorosea TaxID=53429 RepID=UPI0018944F9E|nr:DUF3558 domain-containing protein [Nocardia flavorosea]MBF6350627.1 DUF3558 domain-containing protein [Nocardia flavorosea]
MISRNLLAVAAAAGAFMGLVACSTPAEPRETAVATSESSEVSRTGSARPTLTESRLQPPPLENDYTNQGRPEVVFDPCTWINDEAVSEAGLDPATRRRGQDVVAEYTFLTCNFDGELRNLSIESGNVAWEEDLQRYSGVSEPLTVNGREALLVQDPDQERVCGIHVRTEVGFVMFSSTRTFEGNEAGLQRCDGVLEIVTALEPEIGPEN